MLNVDDHAKLIGSDDLHQTSIAQHLGYGGQLFFYGLIWAVAGSMCFFWLREAIPDPIKWWIWIALVLPAVVVVVGLLGLLIWKRMMKSGEA